MDNLKSYLITRLAAVMGVVAVLEIIVLIPVRRILLPIAAAAAQIFRVLAPFSSISFVGKAQIFRASAIFWCIVSGAPTCEFFVFSSFSTVTPHSGSFSSPTVSGYTATRSMTCSFLL